MKKLICIVLLLAIKISLSAQPLTLDPTFQPSFDLKKVGGHQRGNIGHILESKTSQKIFIGGSFHQFHLGKNYYGLMKINRNGSVDPLCVGFSSLSSSSGAITQVNDNSVAVTTNPGFYLKLDTNCNFNDSAWLSNYLNNTVRCSRGFYPYFYPDGSMLTGNTQAARNGCNIIQPPDTFGHRFIIKVDPQGYWDSSFVPDANHFPTGFIPYDSNRIIVWGLLRDFTQYDGKPISGLCRIFLDGTLDTTFQSPLKDTLYQSTFKPIVLNTPRGKELFLAGIYYLKNDIIKKRYLVRLKENGEVDSNFAHPLTTHFSGFYEGINSIAANSDGGYIVAGAFDHYQGVAKNYLAKIDSNGVLEPHYFTSSGPDSSTFLGIGFPSVNVKESRYGGYYVYGDFAKWDGQSVQPIVRLRDITVGLENHEAKYESIELFPNPVKEQLNLQFNERQKIKSVSVFDLLGKSYPMAWQSKKYQLKLDVSELPKGIYLLQLETEKGLLTEKFVKE